MALSQSITMDRSFSHRIATRQALVYLRYAQAKTIAIAEAVLRGQFPINEWRQAYWLELGAETACIALHRGFGDHYH
ncbi:hypothetical protein BGAL_0512g00030 [Botrytis galanthina]|uniref:Uncharacterized protein n=1 Tax=Botrytis galanthina TaxID=278940 RepID=A0A4S8QUR1_9HELO|nr:hypothetical protein BGAL_0512g00030 [Botrytis galanthina]